jgi:predicted Zn finger-like uncharacterized protein
LHIRCERCSTLYELDEGLLAPEGTPVQCTRCNHVFTAVPPRAAERAAVAAAATVPAAATPPAAAPAASAGASAPEPDGSSAPAAAAPAPPVGGGPRPPARAYREGPPPVYRPSAPAARPVGPTRGPIVRRDTVGVFEARLRANARWKWLAPLLVVLLAGVAGATFWLTRPRSNPEVERARAAGMALVALDDPGSLDRALGKFDEALRLAPGRPGAEADRALALALRASALRDEQRDAAARLAAMAQERVRLAAAAAPGSEPADAERAAAARALEAEMAAREERAKALAGQAEAALGRLEREHPGDRAVARALAILHASGGRRDAAVVQAERARAAGPEPWADLALALADDAGADASPGGRDGALARLGALAASQPTLLRARYLLARAQAGAGRQAEAVATLDGLLLANPAHERARRLREALVAPPPPPAPPPEEKPVAAPRKAASAPRPAEPALAPRPPPDLEPDAGRPAPVRSLAEDPFPVPTPAPPPPVEPQPGSAPVVPEPTGTR